MDSETDRKARAEHELAATGTESARDALLAAQIENEPQTQDAIELCQECGERHAADARHHVRSRVSDRRDNVILVDFRPAAERT